MEVSIPSLLILTPLFGGAAAFLCGLVKLRLTAGILTTLFLGFGLGISLRGAGLILMAGGIPRSGSAVLVAGGWLPGVGIELRYDGVAAVMAVLFFLVALLVLLHALSEGERRPIFFGVYSIALAGMIGVVLSADLFNLFVFFEVLSLSAAILVAYERTLPAMQAAFRYLLVATLSISLYLLGIFLLYRLSGELSFSAVAASLSDAGGSFQARLALVLLFGALATRVALVPFHGWLPEAHGQAPTAVSALLSGLMLKAGFVAFWHVLQLFPISEGRVLLAWVGALSALLGAVIALLQEDAKRLLAYSSISQLGYIATAAGAGAFGAAFYHLLSHAFYKSLLFLLIGGWVHQWGARGIESIRHLRAQGAGSRWEERIKGGLLLLGVAAIVGLPPFSAYVSKGLMGLFMKGEPVYIVIQVAGVVTAAALLKLGLIAIPKKAARVEGRGGAEERQGQGASSALGEGETPGVPGRSLGVLSLLLLFLPTLALGGVPEVVTQGLSNLGIPELSSAVAKAELYGWTGLLSSLWPVALGLLLLAMLRTPVARRIMGAPRRLGVDGAMALVGVGTVAIGGVLLLYGSI